MIAGKVVVHSRGDHIFGLMRRRREDKARRFLEKLYGLIDRLQVQAADQGHVLGVHTSGVGSSGPEDERSAGTSQAASRAIRTRSAGG